MVLCVSCVNPLIYWCKIFSSIYLIPILIPKVIWVVGCAYKLLRVFFSNFELPPSCFHLYIRILSISFLHWRTYFYSSPKLDSVTKSLKINWSNTRFKSGSSTTIWFQTSVLEYILSRIRFFIHDYILNSLAIVPHINECFLYLRFTIISQFIWVL